MVITRRELEVLRLLARGRRYGTVATQLGLSVNTVATHVKKLYLKLDVHTAAAAVMRGIELRLIERVERGNELAPVNLRQLAAEVVEDLRSAFRFRGQVDVAPLPRCIGDASLLRQLLHHLLANAMKFSRHTAQPRIELRGVRLSGGSAEYCVRDNGRGFDARRVRRLFASRGAGLGAVQRIVGYHGGEVRAHSEPGRGAAFYFTLPTA